MGMVYDFLGNPLSVGDTILCTKYGCSFSRKTISKLSNTKCYFQDYRKETLGFKKISAFRSPSNVISLSAIDAGKVCDDYSGNDKDLRGVALFIGTQVVFISDSHLYKGTIISLTEQMCYIKNHSIGTIRRYKSDVLSIDR